MTARMLTPTEIAERLNIGDRQARAVAVPHGCDTDCRRVQRRGSAFSEQMFVYSRTWRCPTH